MADLPSATLNLRGSSETITFVGEDLLPPFDPVGCTRYAQTAVGARRDSSGKASICARTAGDERKLKLAPPGCGHIRRVEIHAAGRGQRLERPLPT
jgi:hypothetical protein